MRIVCIGLSFRSAPVEVRERIAFTGERLALALSSLRALPGVGQVVILTTCNRTEIYTASTHHAGPAVRAWLFDHAGLSADSLWPHVYELVGHEAADHLCRVAAGLDSQLLGEAEILGQVKAALGAAKGAEVVGSTLERLFLAAVAAGRRARHETRISRGAFSAGRCAVETAKRVLGPLGGRTFLILGAGKIAESAARHLRQHGADTILVANRTHSRAQEMADEIGGRALRYDQLTQGLVEADIVISSTAAPHYVLLAEHVAEAMSRRDGRELFLLDTAVPRDIDPEVASLPGVHLYDIDDLTCELNEAVAGRAAEVVAAEAIVSEEAEDYWQWLVAREAVTMLNSLHDRFTQAQDDQLGKFARKLARLSPEDRKLVADLAGSLTKRLLHETRLSFKQELALGNGQAATLRAAGESLAPKVESDPAPYRIPSRLLSDLTLVEARAAIQSERQG